MYPELCNSKHGSAFSMYINCGGGDTGSGWKVEGLKTETRNSKAGPFLQIISIVGEDTGRRAIDGKGHVRIPSLTSTNRDTPSLHIKTRKRKRADTLKRILKYQQSTK